MEDLTADELISLLRLEPHPEGGFYRETFRDIDTMTSNGRPVSTAIFFLLKDGEVSRWHRVDAVEVWHHYAGAALLLSMAPPEGLARDYRLGCALKNGEVPQLVVPAGHWQQARSLGAYSLVGCTVAPGFEFSGFEMAPKGFDPVQPS